MEKIIVNGIHAGSLTGKLILIPPDLTLETTTEAMVFITRHDQGGAKGFVIDQALPGIQLRDLLTKLDCLPFDETETRTTLDASIENDGDSDDGHNASPEAFRIPGDIHNGPGRPRQIPCQMVFWGGPIEPNHGFVLHTLDFHNEHTYFINESYGMSDHKSILRAIGEGRGPKHYMVLLGHVQWRESVLESEIIRHFWIPVACPQDILFDFPPEDRWEAALQSIGSSRKMLSLNHGFSENFGEAHGVKNKKPPS